MVFVFGITGIAGGGLGNSWARGSIRKSTSTGFAFMFVVTTLHSFKLIVSTIKMDKYRSKRAEKHGRAMSRKSPLGVNEQDQPFGGQGDTEMLREGSESSSEQDGHEQTNKSANHQPASGEVLETAPAAVAACETVGVEKGIVKPAERG